MFSGGRLYPRLFQPELTSKQFGELLSEVKAAILPVGSIEWHGPHLPLGLDLLTTFNVSMRVSHKMYPRILVAMPVTYGVVRNQMRFPGSCTVEPHVFIEMMVAVCQSLNHHGISKVVILNGHGSNRPAVLSAALRASREFAMKVVPASYWDFVPPEEGIKLIEGPVPQPYQPRETGYPIPAHGGEFETSLALALFPELVQKDQIGEYQDKATILADAEKGEVFTRLTVEGLASWLEDFITGKVEEARPTYESKGYTTEALGVKLWYFLAKEGEAFVERWPGKTT